MMKFIFAPLVFFTLTTEAAEACPNLDGAYLCQAGSDAVGFTIASTPDGIWMDRDGAQITYQPDGRSHAIPDTESYQNGKVTSSCKGDKLVVELDVEILYEGSVIARQVSRTEYSRPTKNLNEGLKIVTKTKMKGLRLPTKTYACRSI